MLRILHTADVHLGARHTDLGERATAQRERQFAAFARTIELALAEKVDLFLVAGDLFDSNVQPRRSVDRVVAQLKRLVEAKMPFRFNCVVTSSTAPTVPEVARMAIKYNARAVNYLNYNSFEDQTMENRMQQNVMNFANLKPIMTEACDMLEEAGIALEENELLIEREILANGKSRAFAASRPVTAALLKQLAPWLGDIHGQNEQQQLHDTVSQRGILDEFAGKEVTVAQVEDFVLAETAFNNTHYKRQVLAPLENADLVGLDLTQDIHDVILRHLDRSEAPAAVLREKVKKGELGMKSGKGFYDWTPETADADANERTGNSTTGTPAERSSSARKPCGRKQPTTGSKRLRSRARAISGRVTNNGSASPALRRAAICSSARCAIKCWCVSNSTAKKSCAKNACSRTHWAASATCAWGRMG